MSGNEGRLERIKRTLYQRDRENAEEERHTLTERDFGVRNAWPVPSQEVPSTPSMARKKTSHAKTVLIGAGLFFLASVILSAYFLLGGASAVSARNIDIAVEGPVSVSGGDEVTLQISITNRNQVALETADLLVEYPEGTRSADNVEEALPRYRESLGSISSGEKVNRTVRAVLFGEADAVQEIRISLEYRVENSNAIFYKDTIYEVKISSTPLSVSVDALDETVSGQEVAFTATISSNASDTVRGAMLEVEYPFGFEFTSAAPEPTFSDNTWFLADIPPEGTREVVIRGTLTGQDKEERVFQFKGGIVSPENQNRIGAVLTSASHSMFIQRPFIGVNLALNGETANDYVVAAGERVRVDITWKNNLSTQITDAQIAAQLSGAFDESSVSVSRGFYRSQNDTVVWDSSQFSELAAVAPGDSGQVSFTFQPRADTSVSDPTVNIAVSVKGRRLSDQNVPEMLEANITRSMRVVTNLALTSRAVYFVGPLQNDGPIPPKAEQETTYTVIWTVTNATNDVSNAVVSATLPPYVEWLGVVDPSDEDVVYRPVGGEVVWNVGSVEAGVGHTKPPREVAFQIALMPSLSQVGQRPVLITNQRVVGTDVFAEVEVQGSVQNLTTELSTDPRFTPGQGEVTQ